MTTTKCQCCKKHLMKMKKDVLGRFWCKFCYQNCPSHCEECRKPYSRTWREVKHKLINKSFFGYGDSLCTGKSVKSWNAQWYWEFVTCPRCLAKRAK